MTKLNTITSNTFFRFCIVGGIAFIIDGGILTLGVSVFDFSPVSSRSVSFSLASIFSWIANRNYTFGASKKGNIFNELTRYLGINIFAFGVNWLVYITAITNFDFMYQTPVIALIPSIGCSMLINYFGTKRYAFRIKNEL